MPLPSQPLALKPFWTTSDGETVKLFQGDVISVLKRLPSKIVQCVATSPPYWGLRNYGTAEWNGGDAKCDHIHEKRRSIQYLGSDGKPGKNNTSWQGAERHSTVHLGDSCKKCGATRTDQQLGSEKLHDCLGWATGDMCKECFICHMVLVFREVRRVLRDDGTIWLNIGDTYGGGGNTMGDGVGGDSGKNKLLKEQYDGMKGANTSLAPGNLCMIPFRLALALQANGWVLRQDIIWKKPSPMPESCNNRCTKSHEFIFLLTKGRDYYCDMEAIREDAVVGRSILPNGNPRSGRKAASSAIWRSVGDGKEAVERGVNREGAYNDPDSGRNKRDVWSVDDEQALFQWMQENDPEQLQEFISQSTNKTDVWKVSSQAYSGAHFATFPYRLIEPCILAGSSAYGCCEKCGSPWKRVTQQTQLKRDRPNEYVKRTGEAGTGNSCSNSVAGVSVKTLGWEPSCKCYTTNGACNECGAMWGSSGDVETAYQPEVVPVGNRNVDASRGDKTRKIDGKSYNEAIAAVKTIEREKPCDCLDDKVVPCTVLDPFIGSGTTSCVSLIHGRRSVGIDLSETYLKENAIPRITGELMKRPALAHLAGHKTQKVTIGKAIGKKL